MLAETFVNDSSLTTRQRVDILARHRKMAVNDRETGVAAQWSRHDRRFPADRHLGPGEEGIREIPQGARRVHSLEAQGKRLDTSTYGRSARLSPLRLAGLRGRSAWDVLPNSAPCCQSSEITSIGTSQRRRVPADTWRTVPIGSLTRVSERRQMSITTLTRRFLSHSGRVVRVYRIGTRQPSKLLLLYSY